MNVPSDAQVETNTEAKTGAATEAKSDALPDIAGLDFDFLRYMGVRPENQRKIQAFYLPLYRQCHSVLDLGCGDADFVELLLAHGIHAVGVDADERAFVAAQGRGLPVIRANVFDYLRQAPAASVDGIFCAHLVEHLSYPHTIELIQLCYRVLKPGGVITLATPDPRSLFSHLEMFYLHFGHITFYHPRLLCFFLEHEGFAHTEFNVNPETASPLMSQLQGLMAGDSPDLTYRREIPPTGDSWLRQGSYRLKRTLTRWLVQPLVDDLTYNINQELIRSRAQLQTLATALDSLNGPFECYATARKPESSPPDSPSPETGAARADT